MSHDHSTHETPAAGFWGSRYSLGLLAFGAVALFLLMNEHRAHVFGVLPLLLLLACPLMHLFMHGGHGGHGQAHDHAPSKDGSRDDDGGAP
jgi:hypothetical protein